MRTIQYFIYNNNNFIHFCNRSDSQSSAVQPTNFQQLIDLINNWTVSLENQEKQFLNQANEITVWDNMLTNQSTKVIFMNYVTKNM